MQDHADHSQGKLSEYLGKRTGLIFPIVFGNFPVREKNNKCKLMKRRELIKLVTLSTGAILSTPLIGSLLSSCNEANKIADTDYVLQFFDNRGFFTY